MCLSIIQYSNGVIGFENIVDVEVNYTFNGFRYTICMCIEVYIRTTNKKRKKKHHNTEGKNCRRSHPQRFEAVNSGK